MSWDFLDATNEDHVGRCPSTGSHNTFSFWGWIYVAASKTDAADGTIFREHNNRIVVETDNANGHDNIDIERSGLTGIVTVDLSVQGYDETSWLFIGLSATGSTLNRLVLGDESRRPVEITPDTNTWSGTPFTASNYKYVGNAPAAWGGSSQDYLHGSVHSFGFHNGDLSLAEFETAWETFDQSEHADYTFLLDAASNRTAQSGTGTCEIQSATLDSDAPVPVTDASITVQRGLAAVPAAGTTESISAVDALADAFELLTHSRTSSAGRNPGGVNSDLEADDMSLRMELTAVGTLTFTRVSGSDANDHSAFWEVLECHDSGGPNEFIVRSRNTVTVSSGSGSQTLDTTPTNTDKCIPFVTGVTSTSTANSEDELLGAAWIDDSGTLQVRCSGSASTVQVVVVEFTGSNWSVGHAVSTTSADSGTLTLNTDSDGAGGSTHDVTDWADTWIIGQHADLDATESLAASGVKWDPPVSGTTTVDYAYDSGNAGTGDTLVVHTLTHPDMVVTRFSSTTSTLGTTNLDITSAGLTSISQATVDARQTCSGTGDAMARGWSGYRLTSTTNVEIANGRSGNTRSHKIQVIDWSGLTNVTELTRATESDTAEAFSSSKTKSATRVTETDAARTLSGAKASAATRAASTSAARTFGAAKARQLTRATEASTARTFSSPKSKEIVRAVETSAARSLGAEKVKTFTRATESDNARILTGAKSKEIVRVTEADTARGLTEAEDPVTTSGVWKWVPWLSRRRR